MTIPSYCWSICNDCEIDDSGLTCLETCWMDDPAVRLAFLLSWERRITEHEC